MKDENKIGLLTGVVGKIFAKHALKHQIDRNKEQSARLLTDPMLFEEIDELHKSLIPTLIAAQDIRTYPVGNDDLEVIVAESLWLCRQPVKTRRRIDSVVRRFLIKHGIGNYAYDWLEGLILYQKPVIKYPIYNLDILSDLISDKTTHVTYTADERNFITDYVKGQLEFTTKPPKRHQKFWRDLNNRLQKFRNFERRKPTLANLALLAKHGESFPLVDNGVGEKSSHTKTYRDIATSPKIETENDVIKMASNLKSQASRFRRKYGLREISPKLVSLLRRVGSISSGYKVKPDENRLYTKTRARDSKGI